MKDPRKDFTLLHTESNRWKTSEKVPQRAQIMVENFYDQSQSTKFRFVPPHEKGEKKKINSL